MTKNIRQQVQRAIYAGEPLAWAVQERQPGIRWTATGEFIPLADLNFNESLGFYRMSAHPDAVGLCTNEPEDTIHRAGFADWQAYVWSDNGGTLVLLGELWQIADLYQVLGQVLDGQGIDEEVISEDDPAWGHSGDMTWASREAVAYGWYSGETLTLREKLSKAGHRIRRAAQRGTIRGATVDETGHWVFRKAPFRGWLVKLAQRQGGNATPAVSDWERLTAQLTEEEQTALLLYPGYCGGDSSDMETFVTTAYQTPLTSADLPTLLAAFRTWYKEVAPDEFHAPVPLLAELLPPPDDRPTIEEHVAQAIAEGMPGRLVVQDGVPGVIFPDENKFIPFADLNYNSTYGYYEISGFPDLARDCRN